MKQPAQAMPEIPAAEPVRQKETTLEFLSSLASVFVIGLFVITFVLQAFEIPSASMEKTLLIGDHVFVDRITLAPAANWMPLVHYRPVQRGDIVVFLKPGEPDLFLVKRVVGVPGDHIHLKDGVVYRNSEPLNEPFARKPADAPAERQFDPYRDQFPSMLNDPGGNQTATWQVALPGYVQNGDLVVPPDSYFCMGDNRPESLDSRYWGFVPKANVVGRPLFVYWSFITPADQMDKRSIGDRLGFIVHIITHFFTETRWSRTLHLVK